MMDDHLRGMHTTFTTSTVPSMPTLSPRTQEAQKNIQDFIASQASAFQEPAHDNVVEIQRTSESTVNGVVIGLLSSFGSAFLIALIFLIVYFFRYTSSGRILLDRIGRPGEYDDEQQYAREEAEALEEMDDLQRAEYLRAKGMHGADSSLHGWVLTKGCMLIPYLDSLHSSKPSGFLTYRHFIITISSDSRKGCFSLGV
jgi:hypothetical protein